MLFSEVVCIKEDSMCFRYVISGTMTYFRKGDIAVILVKGGNNGTARGISEFSRLLPLSYRSWDYPSSALPREPKAVCEVW